MVSVTNISQIYQNCIQFLMLLEAGVQAQNVFLWFFYGVHQWGALAFTFLEIFDLFSDMQLAVGISKCNISDWLAFNVRFLAESKTMFEYVLFPTHWTYSQFIPCVWLRHYSKMLLILFITVFNHCGYLPRSKNRLWGLVFLPDSLIILSWIGKFAFRKIYQVKKRFWFNIWRWS